MIKPSPVVSFWYRDMFWETGKKYRNEVFTFRKNYDPVDKTWSIQCSIEKAYKCVPGKKKCRMWSDFCPLDKAIDIKEA